ncbi:MAG: hypothetical protein J6A63_01805 [Clostridia bacterium]|nr:hypothetical protein [Clostridia bacterium]
MKTARLKLIAIIAAFAITLASFIHTTVSYFVDSVVSPNGHIATGSTDVELVSSSVSGGTQMPDGSICIMPGQTVGKSVSTKNTGTLPLYVRVKVTPEIILADAYQAHTNEIDLSLIAFNFDAENWLLQDGYYHYAYALTGGTATNELFTQITFSKDMGNIYKDSKMRVIVRIEVVQASNNGENVLQATGWATAGEGGIA